MQSFESHRSFVQVSSMNVKANLPDVSFSSLRSTVEFFPIHMSIKHAQRCGCNNKSRSLLITISGLLPKQDYKNKTYNNVKTICM